MLLNVFNRLIKITKENETVKNFMKELSEFIEGNLQTNNIQRIPRKEQSLIQALLEQNKLTTRYRDKMHVERGHILEEYAEQTADKGEMYYIYNKDDDEIDIYHLCICDKNNRHRVIEVQESDLPEGAGVDSVLRIENEKYVLDNIATEKVYKEMEDMVTEVLAEQKEYLESCRIEGHSYEFIEQSQNGIWLMDIDKKNNYDNCFQDLKYLEDPFVDAKEGDIFKYTNGEYIKWNEEIDNKNHTTTK